MKAGPGTKSSGTGGESGGILENSSAAAWDQGAALEL